MIPHPGLFLFGLTGGVASGKSTVGRLLSERGVTVIDADDLARRVVEPGQAALVEIQQHFGSAVLRDGKLDRAALGKLVFANPTALAQLNAVVHPKVAEALRQRLAELAQAPNAGTTTLVCYEVPLLFENRLDEWLRPVVLVACPERQQIERAVAREGWTEEHAQRRVQAQMPLSAKQARADFVIDNSTTLEALVFETERTLLALRELALSATPSSVA